MARVRNRAPSQPALPAGREAGATSKLSTLAVIVTLVVLGVAWTFSSPSQNEVVSVRSRHSRLQLDEQDDEEEEEDATDETPSWQVPVITPIAFEDLKVKNASAQTRPDRSGCSPKGRTTCMTTCAATIKHSWASSTAILLTKPE